MLIFATALVALMAGALFYAARIPVSERPAPAASEAATLEVVKYPEFTLPDISGTARDFSEWQGKHRLINFWATWCAPCRREIPLLKSFQDLHANDGFQVLVLRSTMPRMSAPTPRPQSSTTPYSLARRTPWPSPNPRVLSSLACPLR